MTLGVYQNQEHRNTLEHPGTPEQPKNPGTPNLTVLLCYTITDHVKKIQCKCNLFTCVYRKSLELVMCTRVYREKQNPEKNSQQTLPSYDGGSGERTRVT